MAAILALAAAVSRPAAAADGDLPPGPREGVQADVPARTAPPSAVARVQWELAGLADYSSPPIRGGTNPFGVGFGGRLGLSVSGVYVGLALIDYLGGTDVTLSDRALLFGAEIGYGVLLHEFSTGASLTLRPVFGVGNAAVSHTDPALAHTSGPDVVTTASGRTIVTGGSTSDTTTIDNVYVRPALALILTGRWHFVALEGGALLLPGIGYGGADPSTWISYGAQVQMGLHF